MSAKAKDRLSVAAIEDRIGETRARLSHSLMLVDRDYGLRHAFVHGVRVLHLVEPDNARLRESARREAVPLSLIGAGLAWLILMERGDAIERFWRGIAHIRRLAGELLAPAERPGEVLTIPGRQANPAMQSRKN